MKLDMRLCHEGPSLTSADYEVFTRYSNHLWDEETALRAAGAGPRALADLRVRRQIVTEAMMAEDPAVAQTLKGVIFAFAAVVGVFK